MVDDIIYCHPPVSLQSIAVNEGSFAAVRARDCLYSGEFRKHKECSSAFLAALRLVKLIPMYSTAVPTSIPANASPPASVIPAPFNK